MALSTIDTSSISGLGYGFKNRLINGGMGIWQRGTSGFTTLSNYAADRFYVFANTSLSAVAQSSDVPAGFKYSISVAGTNYPQLGQRIESVNCTDLASQNVTISFWAKQTSGAGAGSIGLQLLYVNSADNWAGGSTLIGSAQTFTGTSGWAQYSYTFTSLPANAANGLLVLLYANTASTATVLFTGVQLEAGTVATSFDWRSYGTELALCQRYFEKSVAQSTAIQSTGSTCYSSSFTSIANGIWYQTIKFAVTKRVNPTVTTYPYTTTTNTNAWSNNIGTDYGANSATPGVIYDSQFSIQNGNASALSVGSGLLFGSWYASAEL